MRNLVIQNGYVCKLFYYLGNCYWLSSNRDSYDRLFRLPVFRALVVAIVIHELVRSPDGVSCFIVILDSSRLTF
jgi:hypothetical protein